MGVVRNGVVMSGVVLAYGASPYPCSGMEVSIVPSENGFFSIFPEIMWRAICKMPTQPKRTS